LPVLSLMGPGSRQTCATCVQPAPKSRFVVSGLSRTRAMRAGANALRFLGSCIGRPHPTFYCRSALARDLPGTGSKSCVCGLPDTAEVFGLTTTSQQIAGKVERHPRSLLRPAGRIKSGQQRGSLFAWPWLLIWSSPTDIRCDSGPGWVEATRSALFIPDSEKSHPPPIDNPQAASLGCRSCADLNSYLRGA
jgi:hypothetical protein